MENIFNPPQFAQGSLVGIDGNAFSILSYFSRAAKKAGWSREDITNVRKVAMSGDYDHLVRTVFMHLTD